MDWHSKGHSANFTDDFVFNQLIPYIGNKRKLLGLIGQAIAASGATPGAHDFVDLFAGTGVVSRFAKQQGFRTITNDWEPYSEIINRCYIETPHAPHYFGSRSYDAVLQELNALAPRTGWVTKHLCPADDDDYDIARERMFYMRKNGRRIDAIREQIAAWKQAGDLTPHQEACLLAPLLYSACYNSNTSGVFKGFHNGWGGQTGTALYRIAGDLKLRAASFFDNGQHNLVLRADAQDVAQNLKAHLRRPAFVYIDPPYNQHPYGANYHVLNSVALWDKPALSPTISGHGDKSAIRLDWRSERRSAYNSRGKAADAYGALLQGVDAAWLATSYSTDGFIALDEMVRANHAVGDVAVFARGYKRYRVSSQRYSHKPKTVEFVLLTKVGAAPTQTVQQIVQAIVQAENTLARAA